MGKSPGKWIKTVLLGKKHSKSNLSKGAKVENNAVPEQPEENLHLGNSVVAEAAPYQSQDRSGAEEKSENNVSDTASSELAASLSVKPQLELNDAVGMSATNDEDTARIELAATKAQAAFRGYLARRAFWALKGIIRLQALIRGHLVRRQAVATLHCLHCIVRLQALARGRMVRILYPGYELSKKVKVPKIQDTASLPSVGMNAAFRSQKLSANAFARKLLSLLPKAMALSLHYGPEEPNSAWIWLERWSLLHFWEPFAPPKALMDAKSQAKQVSTLTAVGDKGKSRRTFRKVASAPAGENGSLSSFELEKPRRNPRKPASHQTEPPQEQTQSELEKVKRNLRKVSASTMASTEKSEIGNEKSLETPGKASNFTTADVSEPGVTSLSEQTSESNILTDKLVETEKTLNLLKVNEPVHFLHPDANKQNSPENEPKVINDATKNEELVSKEDQTETENQKIRRRKSLPVKQEYHENASQNSASIPSYMAATESAKAKLRLQGSVKFGEDGVENGFVRRHSLPTSVNGKLNANSPRVQKPTSVNGKGGIKVNKSLSSSRDERVIQTGWRR